MSFAEPLAVPVLSPVEITSALYKHSLRWGTVRQDANDGIPYAMALIHGALKGCPATIVAAYLAQYSSRS